MYQTESNSPIQECLCTLFVSAMLLSDSAMWHESDGERRAVCLVVQGMENHYPDYFHILRHCGRLWVYQLCKPHDHHERPYWVLPWEVSGAAQRGGLEFAHLYLKAARTDKGKRNKYSGKSGTDHLVKLQEEMQRQSDKKNSSLDELYRILFK